MVGSRENASAASPLSIEVLGNFEHFRASTLALMLSEIGCEVTDIADHAIAWLPWDEPRPDRPCINRDTDANKQNLAHHFYSVFGYPLGVDPTRFAGDIVQKSLRNGAHDGRVVRGPLANPDPAGVYQYLIDSRTCGGGIIDLRVPYIGGINALAWVKCRPMESRFAGQSAWARLAKPDELFSSEELRLIARFCQAVKLEYGELDVLRDVQSDAIYIVDINPTPYPLTKGIESQEWSKAVRQMANRFQEVFLS